jgi:digeranylgeranylglycerophospholipid reductase
VLRGITPGSKLWRQGGLPIAATIHPAADVLIVGGGPAGLYAAQRLARMGLTVRVLEEHDRVGEPVHCTGILGAEAFNLEGVPRAAILGRENTARFHSPSGHRFGFSAPGDEVCVIDRGAFDRGLADAAVRTGASVTTGARAHHLCVEAGGVAVQAEAGGHHQCYTARACVLATGARYRFQRELG